MIQVIDLGVCSLEEFCEGDPQWRRQHMWELIQVMDEVGRKMVLYMNCLWRLNWRPEHAITQTPSQSSHGLRPIHLNWCRDLNPMDDWHKMLLPLIYSENFISQMWYNNVIMCRLSSLLHGCTTAHNFFFVLLWHYIMVFNTKNHMSRR